MNLRCFLRGIKKTIVLAHQNKQWRKKNPHNHTSLGIICNADCVQVGRETYGILNVHNFAHKPSDNVGLEIGHYCSIADNVHFLLAGEHELNKISTFPINRFMPGVKLLADNSSKGKIVVGDDVWIGYGVTILSGVHVGKGAVIAAGSVVSKDIPPYGIVGGVPAKLIRYRFPQNIVEILSKIDFSSIDYEFIAQHKELFTKTICEEDSDRLQQLVRKLTKSVGD